MRFEKWQALGNDYVIVTEPVDAETVRRVCDRHAGVGADGVLVLSPADDPGLVARLRIFNPDGSEAELSGNGAREAIMYLHRRGWTDAREFSIETVAGAIRPTILDERTCRVDMGHATLGEEATVAGFRGLEVRIGNPQFAIALATPDDVDALDLAAVGPPIEADARFPARTNVSFWTPLGDDRIRARIFERGVGETLSSGTGAIGAAVAHVVRGGGSPVTVVLDGGELVADVGADLRVALTGWAIPVFEGEWLGS
ncbi:MAG TPA: diaminopimelate epimerase [Solirubrobacteraceae bacterium]|jgi:diaminopimelate epimerase|nr:diaminopimelate epimerase [Solirubrobacteraceae bacterium]